jgi:hypothetical protein
MSKDKDPKKAATALYDAMKGFGTNEKKIIETLVGYVRGRKKEKKKKEYFKHYEICLYKYCSLDNETIQKTREEFQAHYHKDLIKGTHLLFFNFQKTFQRCEKN